MSANLIVGVDASRNRSGGAIRHAVGILGEGDPFAYGIREVHIWSYRGLLDKLPDRPWLKKHGPPELEKGIATQLWWQRFRFPAELKKQGCSIVLNTDAGTIGTFRPAVTMSRDMLSYEPGEMLRAGFGKVWLRLLLLRFIQNSSLRRADGTVFLTNHAATVIQSSCGKLRRIALIPHGLGDGFKSAFPESAWPGRGERPIKCLYVSPFWEFKHQWVVVRAIASLRKKGYDITLHLVGGGSGAPRRMLERQVAASDPAGKFVRLTEYVPQDELPRVLAQADCFVFASSCENMPNTLVEAMAVGLPIASSDRGPMPEVLEDGGVYFNPEDDESIAEAIERIILDGDMRSRISARAKALAARYSWSRCAEETWSFLAETYASTKVGV